MTEILTEPVTPQPTPQASADLVTLAPGWWAGGLHLAERCGQRGSPAPPDSWAGAAPTEGPGARASTAPDADGRAARRLARWREAHKLAESGQFDRRLAAAGLTESGLLALLAESSASLAARATRPAWAELTEAALDVASELAPIPEPAGEGPVAWQAGFAVILAPFTELGYRQLAEATVAAGLDELVDLAELRSCFTNALAPHLLSLACRTLVLELNVLRVTDRLTGESAQQRFWSFVRHFAQRAGLTALIEEYPVLARLLAQGTGHAVAAMLELLQRYAADRSAIVAEVFRGTDPGRLVEVAAGRGDTHHTGRSVAVLRFAGGAQLVYKPRPLAAHVHFNESVQWLNQHVADLGLGNLAVLDRGGYGWVEFADHRPCDDRAGIERYYRRQGALLALLYALNGSDFHFENLIACGDQPVLVDLEALFHPQLPPVGPETITGDPARAAYDVSVSRVGLLPMLVFGEGGTVMDMSGNGGDAGGTMPFKEAGWAGAGTDEMHLVREQNSFPGSQNQVRLGDADVDACEFAAEFTAGFRAAYDAIMAHRQELTGPDGPVRQFADDELRVVVRATRIYATLLYESTHPDVLRDALDRDRVLDYLWAMSAGDEPRERVVESERTDLWAGDIPFFATRPGTRDVWTSAGTRLPDALLAAGIDRAVGKVQGLGPRDRAVQEWIVAASFVTRRAMTTGVREPGAGAAAVHDPAGDAGPGEQDGAVDPERALAAARAVGDRLADSVYRDGVRVGWLGLDFIEQKRWLVQPLSYDLYGGYTGVALFLSQLAVLTGEDRYAELAHRAIAPVRAVVDDIGPADAEIAAQCGPFSSLVGLAYALAHVATNIGEPDLLTPIEPLVATVAPGVPGDEMLDIIGGSAGGLVAMLAIHQATGLAAALDVARACADRLVETAEPQRRGVAWRTLSAAKQPLTGFSHGAAGMGWALLRYAAATGERSYAQVGLDAFRYERSEYRPELGNWPDYRDLPNEEPPAPNQPAKLLHAWCHGAPGIGLARADSGHTADPEVASDLDLALRSMLAAGPIQNHSICHGQLGNLELLTVAAANGRPDLAALRVAQGMSTLASIERSGPVCGTPGGLATPDLMTGLSGIGHGLLRLAFPDQVPSVLLLQAPGRRPC